ncbi:hypothetical protein EV368DRAFT_84005 [Lentinula lateritia]|nr:hypothetical protein EV368DRAFT_84005 [Lentinula lateritia]
MDVATTTAPPDANQETIATVQLSALARKLSMLIHITTTLQRRNCLEIFKRALAHEKEFRSPRCAPSGSRKDFDVLIWIILSSMRSNGSSVSILTLKPRENYAFTCLYLTEPIPKISGLLAAPEWYDIVELGGFIVTYVDGSTCYVGMPTDQWREVKDAESAPVVVKRHEGMSRGVGEADEGVVAHVTTAEARVQNRDTGPGACWDLGPKGACISMITVWAGKYHNGVQLHTVDGRASPRWGKCGGRKSTVITTDASSPQNSDVVTVAHSRAVGVKIYLDSHRDHHNASDARPVGLQALVTA